MKISIAEHSPDITIIALEGRMDAGNAGEFDEAFGTVLENKPACLVINLWANRAAAWDVRNLSVYGARMAALHVAAVTRIAEKNARWAARLNPTDAGWSALVASVRVVAEFLTPEVVRGIQERNKPARPAAVPAGSDDDARRAVE